MNWWKSVSCAMACSISPSMFWGVWCSRPTMVEPSSLMPCLRSSLVSVMVSAPSLLAFVDGLHEFQQFHGAPLVQQEVLVHHEERFHVELAFHLAHHVVQFLAGIVEVEVAALAAEEGARGAEVAPHGTTHRGNDGGRRGAFGDGQREPQGARAETGDDGGMANGRGLVLAEKTAHPGSEEHTSELQSLRHLVCR